MHSDSASHSAARDGIAISFLILSSMMLASCVGPGGTDASRSTVIDARLVLGGGGGDPSALAPGSSLPQDPTSNVRELESDPEEELGDAVPFRAIPTRTERSQDDYDWTVSGYYAWGTEVNIFDLPQGNVEFSSGDGLSAVAVGYRLGRGNPLRVIGIGAELLYGFEGVIARRIDDERDHPYLEYVASLTGRFNDFPWRESLHTFFETGAGLSYAEEIPELEVERRGDRVNHLLAYLKLQIGLGLPRSPWDVVALLHHRSGAWGIFDGASGGSNYLGLGVQARF